MKFSEKVIDLLKERPGLTDREITDILKGKIHHQSQVYQETTLLARKGVLARVKRVDGKTGNFVSSNEPPVTRTEEKPFVRSHIQPAKRLSEGVLTIVCISCVKSKRQSPCAAKDMYVSPLFRGMLQYAQSLHPDKIFILSAEYGLLKPEDIITPYEKTLTKMKVSEQVEWARKVLAKLQKETDLEADQFVFLAGAPYRKNLIPHIAHYEVPMEGLAFGKQLQWLTKRVIA